METYYQLFKDNKESSHYLDNEEDIRSRANSINSVSLATFKNSIYYDNKDFNFKEIEKMVNSIEVESFKSEKEILDYFAEIEKIIKLKIKVNLRESSKFYRQILKEMACNLLESKFREFKKFNELYKNIKNEFNKFFKVFHKRDSLIEPVEGEGEIIKMIGENNTLERQILISGNSLINIKKFKKETEKAESILALVKNIYKKNMTLLIDKLNKHFGTKNFPLFLIQLAKYKIKKKINKKYLPKFKEIFLRNHFLNSLEYLLIVDKIKEIANKKLEIFDEKILNIEIREIILKIIVSICQSQSQFNSVVTNENPDPYYKKLFSENIQKYLYALNVNIKYDFDPSINSHNESIHIENQNSFAHLNKILNISIEGDIPGSNYNIQDLFQNLQMSIKNDLETYLFILLSLSLLFNNYDLNQRTILNTSAVEKECLRRILCAFNEYYRIENFDAWKFMQILECVIFSHYFKKAYSKNLVVEKIEEVIIRENTGRDQNNIEREIVSSSDDSHLSEDISRSMLILEKESPVSIVKYKIPFNQITAIINSNKNENLKSDFNQLISSIPKKQKKTLCKHICNFFTEFFFPYEEKEVLMNIEATSLLPYDKMNYSNHVCILIPGFISQNHDNHSKWENFIIDFDIYIDFYFYTWNSRTGINIVTDVMKFLGGFALTLLTRNFLKVFSAYKTYQHKNNLFAKTIKISKYSGKLLAYIIAAKSFFERRSISLVGFSLGGHVLKHCLKELMVIAEYIPDVKDIIQNVVFIGAATAIPDKPIWRNLNLFVTGRIINCYSPNDEVLQGIYKYITQKNAVGIQPLEFKNVKYQIENYDFGELNIKHVEYRGYLNEIIKRINLF